MKRPRERTLLFKVQNSPNYWDCKNEVRQAIFKNYPEIQRACKTRRSTKGKAELKEAINDVMEDIRAGLTDFE